ncbi:stage III sporulation protein AF [Hespellia stercorisuis]|uniref:Stage III sporulation protein AF n=1 Tax=Hespellia stercorisuis DSM 15480 TaxID=1121950 RepID=A0A1M6HNZ1_9FIRM|nr:stage III sporulation protein AF [Hespellia stercorisuis]SHJ23853.1 stage III sporulation protein AF [Hespellia stercorisuis DSM 15480]
MWQYINDWIKNIAYYMILMMAVMQAVPSQEYRKYFRYFTGLLLILLLVTPVFKILGMEENFTEIYQSIRYRQENAQIKELSEGWSETDWEEFLPDEYQKRMGYQ